MKSETTFPIARSERLLIENVGDEAVIYDLETNVAHSLKPLAAAVFMYSDGANSAAEIAELASYRLDQSITESDVAGALVELEQTALIIFPADDSAGSGLSRRDALKTFAAAGAGTLLLTSVAAPAALASGVGSNYTCPKQNSAIDSGADHWLQPGTAGYNPGTGWNSDGTPSGVAYNAPCHYQQGFCELTKAPGNQAQCTLWGGTWANGKCTGYKTTSTTIITQAQCTSAGCGGSWSYRPAPGVWQCIPCDGPTYNCCSVVCAPSGSGGVAWGTGQYSTSCYARAGWDGKYCYSCNGNQN
jgi:hypothetical protein